MAIKHATVKAPGQTLAAVADWNANHVVDGNTGEVLFLTAGGNVGTYANFFWDDVNKRLGIGTTTPSHMLNIAGGDIKTEAAYIGPQSLNETDFATHLKWDVAGDFDDTGGNATWLHNTGAGDLTQTSANMAVPFIANTVYEFIYTVSAVTHVGTLIAAAYDFPNGGFAALDLSPGTHSVLLTSAAVPGDFRIIAISDTGGDGFTLDDFSLRAGGGGNVRVGADAIIDGFVGIGTAAPSEKLHVIGDILASVDLHAASVMYASSAQIGVDADIGIELIVGTNTLFANAMSDNVGIGTATPAVSAKLDIDSTTGALLVPRMTTSQKNALTAVNGMIIYDTDLVKFQGYENDAWTNLI